MPKKITVGETTDKLQAVHKNWQICSVLYKGYREESWYKIIFYAVYVLRTILAPLITLVCVNKPVVQTTCQLLLSVLIIEYILIFKPVKSRINHVQLLCNEGAVLVINISALLLSAIDPNGTLRRSEIRTYLGDLIIVGNVFLNITGIVFLFVKLILEIKLIYSQRKIHSDSEKLPWVRIVAIPLQQGAFGFEELIEPYLTAENELQNAKDPSAFLNNRKASNLWKNVKASQIYPESKDTTTSQLFKKEENALDLTSRSSIPLAASKSNIEVAEPESDSPTAGKNKSLARLRMMRKKPLDVKDENEEEEKQQESPVSGSPTTIGGYLFGNEQTQASRIRTHLRRLQRDQSALTSSTLGVSHVDVGRPPSTSNYQL